MAKREIFLFCTMDALQEEYLSLQILRAEKEIIRAEKERRNHIVSLQETTAILNEQIIQIHNEVISLHDINASQQTTIIHLKNENAKLKEQNSSLQIPLLFLFVHLLLH
jgi:hypothetical protein